MNKIFQALIRIFTQLAEFCWINKAQTMIVTILCFLIETISNPGGFINFWLCAFVDVLVSALPETPEDFKIFAIISDFAASYPFIGFGIIFDTIGTMLFFLVFNIGLRLIKFVRG
jgi:hypothetical protein